jgi:hypothetical protein
MNAFLMTHPPGRECRERRERRERRECRAGYECRGNGKRNADVAALDLAGFGGSGLVAGASGAEFSAGEREFTHGAGGHVSRRIAVAHRIGDNRGPSGPILT